MWHGICSTTVPMVARSTSLVWGMLLAVCLIGPGRAAAADVEVFSRAGCPWCAHAERFLADLRRERPDLDVVVRDVEADADARARLTELAAGAGIARPGVPAFRIGGELIVGFRPGETDVRIRDLLAGSQGPPPRAIETPFGRLDVRDVGLPVFTVVLGLLDGFNPCAMWVLLFVLALLVNLDSRTKMLLIAGTFVVVSGLTYFVLMAAWLNAFLLVGYSRPVEIALGLVAAGVGVLDVKDFVAPERGPSLAIPAAAKPGIYARVRRIVQAESLGVALGGAIVLAVLVNLVELACTAGLPALYTRILSQHPMPAWRHYAHLALYNVAYMLDDGIVLATAVVTLRRYKLQERAGRWLKLLGGVVMLALAAALLAGTV
jgi:glutaredoxin